MIKVGVYDCLYCDACNYQCPCYTPLDFGNPNCAYFDVVSHDLQKIKDGQKNLTFGDLEQIIKAAREVI